jgi:hypothetical protein
MLSSIVTLFLIFSFSLAVEAHQPARGKIFATAGPYFYQSFPDSKYVGANASLLGGFALAVEGDVDKNGGLEIGLAYLHQLYFREKNGLVLTEKVKRIKATTGYRHWFNTKFSAGLFFSNSYSIGDVRVVYNSAPIPDGFGTAAQDISDNGMELSLQHEFLSNDTTAGIVDLRYTYSFSAHSDEVKDLYGVVIGIKHFIQSSEKGADATTE